MILEQVDGEEAGAGLVSPPANFGMVDKGVYRSRFPDAASLGFLGGSASDPSCTCAESRTRRSTSSSSTRRCVLIHCKRGKHRTGCLVGCFRKLQNWCLSSVFEEYNGYAAGKSLLSDLRFIESFDATCMRDCMLRLIYRYYDCLQKSKRLLYEER